MLEFVGEVAHTSVKLETVHIENTQSKAEDGNSLMESLANSSIANTLKSLMLRNEKAWFAEGNEENFNILVELLQNLSNLELIDLQGCGLSEDQWN